LLVKGKKGYTFSNAKPVHNLINVNGSLWIAEEPSKKQGEGTRSTGKAPKNIYKSSNKEESI
jgi:hypothetical protein